MQKSPQHIIEETISTSKLKGEEAEDLRRELESHFAVAGEGSVVESFGDPHDTGQQLALVHGGFEVRKLVVIGALLWWAIHGVYLLGMFPDTVCTDVVWTPSGAGCIATQVLLGIIAVLTMPIMSILMFVPSIFSSFSLAFIGLNVVLLNILYVAITYSPTLKRYFKSFTERVNFLKFLFPAALILHWLALFLSYRKFPGSENSVEVPIATAGFPVTSFWYPTPPMGADYPPIETWSIFYFNYIIWLTVALLVYLLLPKWIRTNKKVISLLMLGAEIVTVFGFGYVTLKFD